MRLGKRSRNDDGKDDGCIAVDLDGLAAIRMAFDFSPADGLVRTRAAVGPVEFLAGVDVHGIVGPVAEKHRIRDLVLAYAATEDDDSCFFGLDAHII